MTEQTQGQVDVTDSSGIDPMDAAAEQADKEAGFSEGQENLEPEQERHIEREDSEFEDDEPSLEDELGGEDGRNDQQSHKPNTGSAQKKFRDVREALAAFRDQLGEEAFQQLFDQADQFTQKAQVLDALLQDPRAKAAFEAANRLEQQADQSQRKFEPIDPSVIDKAIEDGQPVGPVILKMLEQIFAGQLIPFLQERDGQILSRIDRVHARQAESHAKSSWDDFCKKHPGLENDKAIRKVLGMQVRLLNEPLTESRLEDLLAESIKIVGRPIKSSAQAANPRILHLRNRLARTGRTVVGGGQAKKAMTLEEAAEMATQQVRGLRR